MHYALRVVTAGTVFSSNMNLSKNKNIEDEKIKHIYKWKISHCNRDFLFLVSSTFNHNLKMFISLPRTAFFIEHLWWLLLLLLESAKASKITQHNGKSELELKLTVVFFFQYLICYFNSFFVFKINFGSKTKTIF